MRQLITTGNLATYGGGVLAGSIVENIRRADQRNGAEGPESATGAWAFFDCAGVRHRIDYEMFSKSTRDPADKA